LFTRSATWGAIQLLFLFYFGSAVFFCKVLQDDHICPNDPTDQNRFYYGWLTTIYFASVTMATVGYGDINFTNSSAGNPWRMYIGSVFILVSILMGYTVLATAANANLERMGNRSKISRYIVERFNTEGDRLPLHKQIRIVAGFRMAELVLFLIFHVSAGVFAARFAIRYSNQPEHQWSWMTTYYWAIQTVTTVGKHKNKKDSVVARLGKVVCL
jgi:Ion channel